jgi:predicted methyltransferase
VKNILMAFVLISSFGCAAKKPVEPAPAPVQVMKPLPTTLEDAVNGERRSDGNKARDQYRHPLETLTFFEIKPNQIVIEISPSGGWYTEILAPFLAENGKYIGTVGKADLSEKYNASLKTWTERYPEVASHISFVEFGSDKLSLGEPNSADRVLTFRNVHNWMKKKDDKKFFKAFFTVLKPGGILGVEEHRAGKKTKGAPGEKGYVSEKYVINLAKQAGFKLVEKSEINANPKDTADYADGVWTLPPTLTLGDKDREKYVAIGESDRMTLKFVKPEPKAKK